jgi:hypothetical protein
LDHHLLSREQLPLSNSLGELYFVNMALSMEEKMCRRFLNKKHKNFGKDSVVLRDWAGTMDSLHSTSHVTTTHTPILVGGLFACDKHTCTSIWANGANKDRQWNFPFVFQPFNMWRGLELSRTFYSLTLFVPSLHTCKLWYLFILWHIGNRRRHRKIQAKVILLMWFIGCKD